MKHLRLVLVWSLLGSLLQLISPSPARCQQAEETQAPSFEPVIRHEFSPRIRELLIISALDTEAKKLTSPEEADRLYKNTQRAITDLQDNGPSIAAANSLSKDAATLVLFYVSNMGVRSQEERLKTSAQWLEKYSQAYADASKQPLLKSKALYSNAIAKFLLSEGGDGIALLVPLRDQLTGEKVLIANIDLLVGYSLALAPATAAQGFTYMSQATQQISVYGRVAQRLTEALIEFGLDAEGNASGSLRGQPEAKLTYSIQIARGMPAGIQHLVMDTSIFIWLRAIGSKGQKTPTYLTDGFPGVTPVEALREKEALAMLITQNFKGASFTYRTMSAAFQGQNLGLLLDRRIWDIELLQYRKTNQINDLESTFNTLRERYQGANKRKASDAAKLFTEVNEAYKGVLDAFLTQALQPQAAANLRTAAVQASLRYVKLEPDRQQSYPLKAKIAQLYRLMNLFKDAVEMYLDIAKEQPMKNYLLAIEAQSQLAKWPTQPPFEAITPGDNNERIKLLSIYETVNKLKNSEDWFMLAHLGLLNRALGQVQKAEEFWLAMLKINMNSKFALEAGGILMTEFYGAKRWQSLIDLAHLFQARKLGPASKGKPLNYMPWFADALYNGGLIDLQSKNFTRSIKHLEEFIATFANDPRAAPATYSLAFAYKGLNKLVPALNACRAVVDKYPQFNLRPKVMLQGAEWATTDQKTWEYAFFFYTKYLADYKTEANIPQIRVMLAELYLKRKLYGWASRLYKEQSLSPQVAKAQQLEAAIKYMDIEEQFGEPKDAYWGAQRVAELSAANDPSMIRAIAFQGRYVANNKDLKGMADMEPKLLVYSKNSKEAIEAVGLIRFKRAEMLTKDIVYTENNLLLKDPEATVKKYFEIWEQEKVHYQKVCQVGITTLCAPAMLRLISVTQQGFEAVDKVEIAETLGANRVNSFKVFKQLHLNKIQQARKDFGDQALKLAKQGTTTQSWKDEIIKFLEFDKDAEVAH
jgi:hypothetical protein